MSYAVEMKNQSRLYMAMPCVRAVFRAVPRGSDHFRIAAFMLLPKNLVSSGTR